MNRTLGSAKSRIMNIFSIALKLRKLQTYPSELHWSQLSFWIRCGGHPELIRFFFENDILMSTGKRCSVRKTRINVGPKGDQTSRWQDLMTLINDKPAQERLAAFAEADISLLDHLKDEGLLN